MPSWWGFVGDVNKIREGLFLISVVGSIDGYTGTCGMCHLPMSQATVVAAGD